MLRLIPVLVLVSAASLAHAENWPAWRGPTGQGHSSETNLPLKWSGKDNNNIKWKVPLAHQSNSTPVIWGDKIFLTMANKGGTTRGLLCLARADGKLLWQKDITYDKKEQNWTQDWYCNASPAVDAERVVVTYGSAGMYCYDHSGKELWKRTDLGEWQDPFGNSASPVFYEDTVIQWCGPNRGKGRNYLLAVKKSTGATVWETDEKIGSWSTPLLIKHEGKDQLLLGAGKDDKNNPEMPFMLKGYNPKDGKEIWSCKGINSFVYTSALFGDGVAVIMSGYGGSALGVKVEGTGDITDKRLWSHPRNTQRVGSGVILGDHVYVVDENGTPHCYEAKSGNDLWKRQSKLSSGTTWGSLVHADGRLYLLMRNGDTVVLKASPQFEILAVNPLLPGEQSNSSAAISDGEIYLRTFKHLWCVSERK
jgi:outer membrane protein assembly factor BamB